MILIRHAREQIKKLLLKTFELITIHIAIVFLLRAQILSAQNHSPQADTNTGTCKLKFSKRWRHAFERSPDYCILH